MKINCHWALSAVDYKNNDRVVICPRMQGNLSSISEGVAPSNFINNENFTNLRKQLYAGEWPDMCKSCKDYEDKGYKSYRQKANKDRWREELLDYYDPATGKVDFKSLEYIEVRFSNACNLSCLHCSPQWSSKWQSILKSTVPTTEDRLNGIHNLLEEASNQSWTNEQVNALTNDLIENFPNLKKIDVSGGEPLYQKQFWTFLENIQKHPNIHNMDILCTSNFNTKVDYVKLSKLFLPFKDSRIRISFDGGRKIYNYFRNGNYDNIIKNIEIFKQNNQTTTIEGTNTISIYQILDIENIIYDLLDAPIDVIHHSFVQYPKYLSMAALPKRKSIHRKTFEIQNYIDKIKPDIAIGKYKGVRKMCEEIRLVTKRTPIDEKVMKQFVYYANRMDGIKHQSFASVYGKTVEEIIYG